MRYLLVTWGNVRDTPPRRCVLWGASLAFFVCAAAGAQDPAPEPEDYRSLWERGAYREALAQLDEKLEQYGANTPFHWARERAELRFITGDVDGAIADYEELTEFLRDAPTTLRLAEIYQYRGRLDDYKEALQDAARRVEASWRYSTQEEFLLAAGRIAELQGEDPKRILTTIYKLVMDSRPSDVDARIAAGDLAQRKGSVSLAARYYLEALENDPESQEALAQLAACYWDSRDERLGETLARLDALNPHHPGGAAVKVEMALDAGNTADALAIIEDQLTINPNNLHFLALKAAAHFLDYDDVAMKAAQQEALAFNPHASEVQRVPGRVASRHYRFREGAAMQREALAIDEEDYEAQALLGFDLLRLGEDTAGREALDKAFEADPYNVRVYNSLSVMDKLKTFDTVAHGPFEVSLPADESPVLAEPVLELLDEEIGQMEAKYEIELEKPIRIQIFANHDDFMVRSVGLPGSTGHMGICFGHLITMDSPTARPKGSMDWHSVLWHEFVHVVTLQKTKNRMPRWLSEGISVYEETLRNPAWAMKLDPAQQELFDPEQLPKASGLELWFTQPKTPAHLMFGYFLAGEFVIQYTQAHGAEALVDALGRIGNEEDTLAALAAAADIDEAALDEEFQAHLKQRFAVFDKLDAFRQAMRAGVEAEAKQDFETAIAQYQEAHALFPEYAAEDGPLARLTVIYTDQANFDALEDVVEEQLALNTANLTNWRLLAKLAEEKEDWETLERAASGAEAVVPFDTGLAGQLLEAQQKLDQKEAALETAERLAHLDAARAVDYQMTRVELLQELKRWDEAKRQILQILEDKPHYWKAQEVLLALVERKE